MPGLKLKTQDMIERMRQKSMIDPDGRFAPIIEPVLSDFDYVLVRVVLMPSNRGRPQTLQIMVEPKDGGHAAVDVCASISRALSAIFDVEDPVRGRYTLEVSSPGMARPLTRIQDFAANIGRDVKMELRQPNAEGRKRFRGQLVAADEGGETISLHLEGEDNAIDFHFSDLASVKIQVDEEMIRNALNKEAV